MDVMRQQCPISHTSAALNRAEITFKEASVTGVCGRKPYLNICIRSEYLPGQIFDICSLFGQTLLLIVVLLFSTHFFKKVTVLFIVQSSLYILMLKEF